MRPFDIVFFKGHTLFSSIINILEKHGNKVPKSGEFTHVAIIINSNVVNNDKLLPGKLYILESIVGGYFAGGVKDIDGNTFSGVQIRALDEVIEMCDKPNSTTIAWGKLRSNPIDTMPIEEAKIRMTEFCNDYVGKTYDANPYSLLSAVFPCMRKQRNKVEEICGTKEWYFCSEIVAMALKRLDVYSQNIDEKNVLPRDIAFPELDTDPMPHIIDTLTYVTTPLHQTMRNKCHV